MMKYGLPCQHFINTFSLYSKQRYTFLSTSLLMLGWDPTYLPFLATLSALFTFLCFNILSLFCNLDNFNRSLLSTPSASHPHHPPPTNLAFNRLLTSSKGLLAGAGQSSSNFLAVSSLPSSARSRARVTSDHMFLNWMGGR